MEDSENWAAYFEVTKTSPPSETAICAVREYGDNKGLVIDLGCGAGTDSLYFLKNGWNVLAVDSNPEFIVESKSKMPEELQTRLQIEKMEFEDLSLPMAECIIANFSLPFCKPGQFKTMWSKIVKHISIGGIFSGIFFGNRDEWVNEFSEERTFHTKVEVMNMFMKQWGTLSIILSNDTVKGYGFGTRGEELILNYAFNDLGLSTVYADAVIRNTRSQYVLETLGFVYTHEDEMLRYYEIHKDGMLRHYLIHKNDE